jgi:Dolichyl-phosphate-mannose-protein mannosyltransferase
MATTEQGVPVAAGLPAGSRPLAGMTRFAFAIALAVAALTTAVTALASRRNATTFDEIVLMAGGARGYETGRWDIAPEHPPLMQYLYGLPIWLSHPSYPERQVAPPTEARDFSYRYEYSREFFWTVGNDPERIAFLGRSLAALFAGLLALAAYGFLLRQDRMAAVLAAVLVAFLPDVVAHGGVAYNDLPLALAYLLSIQSLDAAVRRPTVGRGALAGLFLALALGIKFSAVILAPVAGLLVAAEAVSRKREPAWWLSLGLAIAAAIVAAGLALVLIYRGDFTLAEFRYGIGYTFDHVSGGHGAPGYLLGRTSVHGWWYFFPVAFLYKTPAALHILLLGAVAGMARTSGTGGLRVMAASPLRAPVIGVAVFGAALVTSSLDIGFRYALPVLPLVCIIAAVGVARLIESAGPQVRWAVAALVLWFAASTLSFYPHFLAYTSEYGPGRDHGDLVLLDSSLDWGQGLLELRRWMRSNGVDRVYLSYFGSGVPAKDGIDYVPLQSFFPLPALGPATDQPAQYAVVSATNLHGIYMNGDPFATLRQHEPEIVLAHTLFVYRINARVN